MFQLYYLFVLISFAASVLGSICGIGGGVIIKPALDATGILNVAAISFLSSCSVFAMSLYSVVSSFISRKTKINLRVSLPLSISAAAGGIAGNKIFRAVWLIFEDKNMAGLIQASCFILLILGTLIYTIRKNHIKTRRIQNVAFISLIGFMLGSFSAFLGIGGGPINMVVLFYFFSMETKEAAENSLFIILFSQIMNLSTSVISNTVPEVDMLLLVLMPAAGILGALAGRAINRKIRTVTVERLLVVLFTVIILINVYNVFRFVA